MKRRDSGSLAKVFTLTFALGIIGLPASAEKLASQGPGHNGIRVDLISKEEIANGRATRLQIRTRCYINNGGRLHGKTRVQIYDLRDPTEPVRVVEDHCNAQAQAIGGATRTTTRTPKVVIIPVSLAEFNRDFYIEAQARRNSSDQWESATRDVEDEVRRRIRNPF